MINPFAFFDSLFIACQISKLHSNISKKEIQIFAYLACLLSIYRRNPISNWGYKYYGTNEGAPYSMEIDAALDQLVISGFFVKSNGCFYVTQRGIEECSLLSELPQNKIRAEYLNGSCSSILALPSGLLQQSILMEPELRHVKQLKSHRVLLEGVSLEIIYSQFRTLNSLIGDDIRDLMIPAVAWLSYLERANQTYGCTR